MSSSTLTAEVISIGDEMTSGARLDTNAQWISRRLGDLGIDVQFHSTVGDTLQHNIDVFRTAMSRVHFVVCTGGLGPTRDDLTRQALAAATDQPLELRQSALEHIEALFSRRSRDMPERNRVQAMFPSGSFEIFNPQGTAPGIDLICPRIAEHTCRIFALPGVPAEMKRMFDDTVAPRILESSGTRKHLEHSVMKFFGVGESDMEQRLGNMIDRDRTPRVGITVSSATISLRITAIAESKETCDAMIDETREEILERVGDLHFGDGEEFEQYHAVEAELRQRGECLFTIEWGHAAELAGWFASLGKSPAYRGGFSFADLEEAAAFCKVDADKVVEHLVQQASSATASPVWCLIVDAYPSLQSPDGTPLPAAEVKFTVLHPNGKSYVTQSRLGGHPAILHPRIGKAALAWLRKVIQRPEAGAE